jgi:Na+-driven multidrug efflux pump
VVIGEAVANLLLSLALVRPFGIEGVAWGTTIPNIIGNLVVPVYVCGLLNVRLVDYLRKSFLKPLVVVIPLAAAWGLSGAWMPPSNWLSLFLVTGIGLCSYAIVAVGTEFGLTATSAKLRPAVLWKRI